MSNIGSVKDIDGNIYKTIIIGNYEWLAENLKVTKYSDGSEIPNITNKSDWSQVKTGAYCWYNNNDSNKVKFGALYNWYTVNTNKLCPDGWRVPSDEDWRYLEGYIDSKYKVGDSIWNGTMSRGFDIGNRLKAKYEWKLNVNDEFGFSALPAGECSSNKGYFHHLGSNGFWWSSTEFDSTKSWYRCIIFFDEKMIRNTHPKGMGFSVRCIKDKSE